MLSSRLETAKQKNSETFYFRKCSTTNMGTVVALVLHQNKRRNSISHFIVVGVPKGYANARSSVSLLPIYDGWRDFCLQCLVFTVWRRRRHRKPIKCTRPFSILSWAVLFISLSARWRRPSISIIATRSVETNAPFWLSSVMNIKIEPIVRAATTVFVNFLCRMDHWPHCDCTPFIGHSSIAAWFECVRWAQRKRHTFVFWVINWYRTNVARDYLCICQFDLDFLGTFLASFFCLQRHMICLLNRMWRTDGETQ